MNALRPLRASSQRGAWLGVACIFAWLAVTAWLRPLMAPDEGRYVGVAFEMLRSGDWLVPRLDGLPFFHKPPLFYWISAAAMSLLGATEWAARMPSMLGGTLAAGALWLFLRRWADASGARLSAVVLVTMPFFYIGAQFANLDMLVAGCISATVLLAAHAALREEQGRPWRAALAGAFVFAALGILAKGLIGLVLPGAVFTLWCATTRRWRTVRLVAWPVGWALLLLVAAPWFVSMQLSYPGFFDYFVVTQHFRRFATAGFNNEHPFWFYLPVIIVLTLPWFGWLPAARKLFKARLSDIDWLMAIWCLCIVVFFSIPRSKLVGYVLPALPPLAYFIARAALARAVASKAPPKLPLPLRLRGTAAMAAAVCLACAGILAVKYTRIHERSSPAAAIQPNDQVLMLDRYDYALPMQWRLSQPVMVASDWRENIVNQHDNWRKELFDAGQFEPARGAQRLVDARKLHEVLCVPRQTWIVGAPNSTDTYAWLAKAHLVAFNRHTAVWRFAGDAMRSARCLEAPAAGPPETSAAP